MKLESSWTSGSTIRTFLHGKINPKNWQVLNLGDGSGFSYFLGLFQVIMANPERSWDGTKIVAFWIWKNVAPQVQALQPLRPKGLPNQRDLAVAVWKLVPLTVRPETKNRPKPKKKGSRIVFIASMCQGRVVKLAGCSCNIDSKGVGRLPFCCGNFYGYNTWCSKFPQDVPRIVANDVVEGTCEILHLIYRIYIRIVLVDPKQCPHVHFRFTRKLYVFERGENMTNIQGWLFTGKPILSSQSYFSIVQNQDVLWFLVVSYLQELIVIVGWKEFSHNYILATSHKDIQIRISGWSLMCRHKTSVEV